MKTILLTIALSCMWVCLHAQTKDEENENVSKTPYADFKECQEAIAGAKKPEDMYPFMTADGVGRMKAIDKQTRISKWLAEMKLMRSYKVDDSEGIETEINGRRAVLFLKGYDSELKGDYDWDVVMIYENKRWQFSKRDIHHKSQIDNDMRTWVVGRDEVEIQAMLKQYDEEKIQLLVADVDLKQTDSAEILSLKELNVVEFPISELSKSDIDYLNRNIPEKELATYKMRQKKYYHLSRKVIKR